MRALVLQHVPFEGSARIGDWIGRHCEHEHVCYLYADAHLPALDSFDLLVVMGGPMSVNDPLPWIQKLCVVIRDAFVKDIPLIGHCLGGQLISKALGGRVRQNAVKEIGWSQVFPIPSVEATRWFGADTDTGTVSDAGGEVIQDPLAHAGDTDQGK